MLVIMVTNLSLNRRGTKETIETLLGEVSGGHITVTGPEAGSGSFLMVRCNPRMQDVTITRENKGRCFQTEILSVTLSYLVVRSVAGRRSPFQGGTEDLNIIIYAQQGLCCLMLGAALTG